MDAIFCVEKSQTEVMKKELTTVSTKLETVSIEVGFYFEIKKFFNSIKEYFFLILSLVKLKLSFKLEKKG